MLYVFVSLLTLMLAAPQVSAEPDSVVRHLQSEPASLFDVGQDRIAARLHSDRDFYEQSLLYHFQKFIGTEFESDSVTGKKGIAIGNASVAYDDTENRISIRSPIYVTHYMDEKKIKPMCAEMVESIRATGGISYGEIRDGKYSHFAAGFAHLGYKTKQPPKDYREQLDRIFKIKVIVYGSESYRPVAFCEGMLVSKEVTFAE